MKKCLILVSIWMLASLNVMASDSMLMVEVGASSGDVTVADTDTSLGWDVALLNHPLSGNASAVGFFHTLDSGLLWGFGYQQFSVSGESDQVENSGTLSGVAYTEKYNFKTVELSLAGPFAAIGYNIQFAGDFHFLPQFRFGIGNRVTYKSSLRYRLDAPTIGYSSDDTGTYDDSGSLSGVQIALPVGYNFGSFSLYYQYQIVSKGYELTDGTTTFTSRVVDSSTLNFGFGF